MTSPVDTSVKFFNEGMPGAPVLNGVAGALIALFDACLITGFGLRACTITVSSGVATVAVASDVKNLNLVDSVQLIAGVAGGMTGFANLNGEQKITSATATTLTFATAVANGTATGTITIKQAPVPYWEKTYSSTNIACYRSTDPATLGAFLQVTDTGTTTATVRMYETMSAFGTGTNPAPAVADMATPWWVKSTAANSTANTWDLFGDSRGFYLCPTPGYGAVNTVQSQPTYYFGDLITYRSVDPYAVWIAASNNATQTYGSVALGQQGGNSQAGARLLRSYTGLGLAIQAWGVPQSGAQSSVSGVDTQWGSFPTIDGKLRLTKIHATEGAAIANAVVLPRGLFPGISYVPLTGGGTSFPRGTRIAIDGRVLVSVRQGVATTETAGTSGYCWIDITGPWR
ncbi:hypothetical protein LJR118_000299 [Acidovorax sp. LjRoot118]|uniref:hypothetical protein n=1 Tax=Acidovorax sp. LjRoot118 TaxID=3342256 RepID=UPI003ECFAB78